MEKQAEQERLIPVSAWFLLYCQENWQLEIWSSVIRRSYLPGID